MTETTNYVAWWERCSTIELLAQFALHPFIVIRQIGVACDFLQAPSGSDQETYPTLLPSKAARIIRQ